MALVNMLIHSLVSFSTKLGMCLLSIAFVRHGGSVSQTVKDILLDFSHIKFSALIFNYSYKNLQKALPCSQIKLF